MSIQAGHTALAADVAPAIVSNIVTVQGVTLSLTTTATQKVVVIAKGDFSTSGYGTANAYLKYNGVQKDNVTASGGGGGVGSGNPFPFCMMYTETPGAHTYNITVTSDGSLANVVIIAFIIGI